jgi:hypothetical protein
MLAKPPAVIIRRSRAEPPRPSFFSAFWLVDASLG